MYLRDTLASRLKVCRKMTVEVSQQSGPPGDHVVRQGIQYVCRRLLCAVKDLTEIAQTMLGVPRASVRVQIITFPSRVKICRVALHKRRATSQVVTKTAVTFSRSAGSLTHLDHKYGMSFGLQLPQVVQRRWAVETIG